MAEQALVFRTDDLFTKSANAQEDVLPQFVNTYDIHSKQIPVGLMSRTFCEQDSNYLQLIPYIALIDITDQEKGKVLVYQRGKAGAEGRLHGKFSIGFGGHVNDEPNVENGTTVITVLAKTAERELEEEVGLLPTKEMYQEIYEGVVNSSVMYLPTSNVELVHAAVFIVLQVNPKDLCAVEQDVIDRHKWMTASEINEQLQNPDRPDFVLEKWTEAFFYLLMKTKVLSQ